MIPWELIRYFTPGEFPEDPDEFAEQLLIFSLNAYRGLSDEKIFPSPVPGALARFDGNPDSTHYAIGKKSTGVDVFPDGQPFKMFSLAMYSGLFRGIGVYFDTHYKGTSKVMLHLDLRPSPLLWYRLDGQYHYMTEPLFWDHLQNLLGSV